MVIKFRVVRCVGHNAYGVDCFYVPCPSAGPYGGYRVSADAGRILHWSGDYLEFLVLC